MGSGIYHSGVPPPVSARPLARPSPRATPARVALRGAPVRGAEELEPWERLVADLSPEPLGVSERAVLRLEEERQQAVHLEQTVTGHRDAVGFDAHQSLGF